jgi:hypothetical protein
MRVSKIVAYAGVIFLAAVMGYGVATVVHSRNQTAREEGIAAETISGVVGIVYLLDSGDIAGTRTALLSMGSANLDPLMEQWSDSADRSNEYLASRCRTITRLRELRFKHRFLMEPSDALLAIPDIKEWEMRRRTFLEKVRC